MGLIAKTLTIPSIGFDTSQSLTAEQYATLKALGFAWCCRYVPLSGQSPTAPGVIQPAELHSALEAGFGVMLVQFARGSGWTAATGQADGKTAAAYAFSLGIPKMVCLWADMGVTSTAQGSADYLNGWSQGAVAAGWAASACGVYFEPGNPMTATQRYQMIAQPRYWATAADDPNRFPQPRGAQLVQLWASSQGQYQPAPGIEIDADIAQLDWLEGAAVAAFAA